MSFEVHPDTTGSYQSQTATTNSSKSPTQTSGQVNRKRPLDDVSNMQPQRSRSCKRAASEKIHSWTAKQAPRGNPKRAAAAREARKSAPPSVQPRKEEELHTLQQVLLHNRETLSKGKACIDTYIERNTPFEMNKGMAINVMCTAIESWGMKIMEASQMAADVVGCSAYSARKWAAEFLSILPLTPEDLDDNEYVESLLTSNRGLACKHPHSLIHDEQFCISAREYVRLHGNVKGKPNLTCDMFREWVKGEYGIQVCTETVRLWLHQLGFSQKDHHKTVYFDGHERSDVVECREEFISYMAGINRRCKYDGNHTELDLNEKPIIVVHHDESTFYANADQSRYWGDDYNTVLKQKSLGQSIMISDFIEEATGDFLHHNDEKARKLVETQQDGYFNSEQFLEQVDTAIDIFEAKFPNSQGLFLFDNAPIHKKYPDDALNADRMNVRPGGKQPIMKDTVFNGEVQKMVTDAGLPKGMKVVLQERGVETKGMNAAKMRETLSKFSDFTNQENMVEQKIRERGHLCKFFPKFHCELNAIERCWCHAKKYTRAHSNGSIVRLRKIIHEGMDTCDSTLIKKFFRTCRDYMKAYENGHTCKDVDAAVKEYKSHRRVFNINQ